MSDLSTLYKMSNSGKVQEWTISCGVEPDGRNYYEVTFGQMNGKMQSTRTHITAGKNLGKKNATTAKQQTEKEAEALWTKKQERSGYTVDLPTKKPLLPMLAKDYNKEKHKLDWNNTVIQPKLDGVRVLAHVKNGVVKLYSRQGKVLTTCTHIRYALRHLDDCILDGELFSKDLTFQEIISAVKRDKDKETTKEIQYHVYDIVDDSTGFAARHLQLLTLAPTLSDPIFLVPTRVVRNNKEVEEKTQKFVADGYEGSMIRDQRSFYKINGRSSGLLKLKSFKDEEYVITDVLEGKGKFAGMGIFECATANGSKFNVTPAATEEEKREIFKNKNSYIGKMLTVQYFELTSSENPVPRFPVGKGVRDYE